MKILAWIVVIIFILMVIPTFGLPEHASQDPRLEACFMRGLKRIFIGFILIALFILVLFSFLVAFGTLEL